MDDISCCRRSISSGFSLVELLVATAVLISLLAVGIPSYNALIAASREYVALSTLRSVLAEARSTAVEKRSRVTLCRASPQGGCMGRATSGQTDWAQTGILVFVDADRDRMYSPGEQVVRRVPADDGLSLVWNRGDALTYEADGTVTGGSNGTLSIIAAEDRSCSLIVSMVGRVRQQCTH